MSSRLRAALPIHLRVAFAAATVMAATVTAAEAPSLPELEAHDVVVGRFAQQRHLPQLERAIASSGRFAYERGRGLLWQVREPVASALVIAEDGVYQDGERVTGAAALRAVGPVFGALFAGELDQIQRRFSIEHARDARGWRLRLTPRDDALAAAIARIEVAGEHGPASLVLIGADGGRTELAFEAIEHPAQLDDDLRRAFGRGR